MNKPTFSSAKFFRRGVTEGHGKNGARTHISFIVGGITFCCWVIILAASAWFFQQEYHRLQNPPLGEQLIPLLRRREIEAAAHRVDRYRQPAPRPSPSPSPSASGRRTPTNPARIVP